MNTMTYKGYSARIEFDAEDRLFVGHLAGVRDIVGFHGRSVVENWRRRFTRRSSTAWPPARSWDSRRNKPFSGRVMLRLPPEVHARASARAKVRA